MPGLVNMPENMPDSYLIAFGAGSQWGRVGYNRLIINGKSNRVPLAVPGEAQTVLLARHNPFGRREIPVHLHRKADCGELLKNTIHMTRRSAVEIDFIDDDPSPNSLHCHHQDHQDKRLMSPATYP
jgi:hypothetical protein